MRIERDDVGRLPGGPAPASLPASAPPSSKTTRLWVVSALAHPPQNAASPKSFPYLKMIPQKQTRLCRWDFPSPGTCRRLWRLSSQRASPSGRPTSRLRWSRRSGSRETRPPLRPAAAGPPGVGSETAKTRSAERSPAASRAGSERVTLGRARDGPQGGGWGAGGGRLAPHTGSARALEPGGEGRNSAQRGRCTARARCREEGKTRGGGARKNRRRRWDSARLSPRDLPEGPSARPSRNGETEAALSQRVGQGCEWSWQARRFFRPVTS